MSQETPARLGSTWLGRSGLEVSKLCLGTMTFGRSKLWDYQNMLNQDQADALMDHFVEEGGNFLDTANAYSNGESEEIIGNWMKKRQNRESLVIATKVRFNRANSFARFPGPNTHGLGRKHIIQEIEGSLERLQTHYVDLYQSHMWDSGVKLEESLRTLDDLVRSGKVRYVGASNMSGWQMQKAMDVCEKWGYSPFVSLQQQYSLLCRESEPESFQVCRNEGLGVLPWSPLKGGLLSGKFKRGMTPEAVKQTDSRVAYSTQNDKMMSLEIAPKWEDLYEHEPTLKVLDALAQVAADTGRTPAQVAIRWLLQKDIVSSVIIGVTKLSQLEDNLLAASDTWCLSTEQMGTLDSASNKAPVYPYKMIVGANMSRQNPH